MNYSREHLKKNVITVSKNLTFLLAFFYIFNCSATNYTWNGNTSTAWATSTNWTPNGVPGAGDNVSIVSKPNAPVYDGVAGVTNLTMTSGTLNLNGYTLTATGTCNFYAGTISNGKLNLTTTGSVTFWGTIFNCKVTSASNTVYFNGSVFNDTTRVTRNPAGTGNHGSNGGNKFNAYTEIINKSTGAIMMANSAADTAYNTIVFSSDSTGEIHLAYGPASSRPSTYYGNVHLIKKAASNVNDKLVTNTGKVEFRDTVFITNLSTKPIYFGGYTDTQVYLKSDAVFVLGTSGFTGGRLYIDNFDQQNTTDFNLTFGSSASISIGATTTINGNFTWSGRDFALNGATFNGDVSFSQSGSSYYSSSGGNTFNGSAAFYNTGSGTMVLADSYGDNHNGNVHYTRSSGTIYPASAGVNYFAGDITATGGSLLHFGNSFYYSMNVLDGTAVQEISGTTTEIRFKKLKLNKTGSYASLAQDIVVTDSLLFVDGIMETGTYSVILKDNTKIKTPTDSSHIAGKVKKIGNDAFTFPVGKGGHYRSLAISAPGNTADAFTAEYFNLNSNDTYTHSSKDGSLNTLSSTEYWTLNRNNGTSNISVTLSWDTIAASCSFASAANLKVGSWDGSQWKDRGNGGTTGTLAKGTVVSSGTSSTYGAYALGTSSSFYCVPCYADAGPDMTVPFGESVLLGADYASGITYSWLPADTTFSCTDCALPFFTPADSGEFSFTLQTTNTKGCVASDYVKTRVLPQPEESSFCAFTPKLVRSDKRDVAGGGTPNVLTCGNFDLIFQDVIDNTGFGFDDATDGADYRQCVCDAANYIQTVIEIPGGADQIEIFIPTSLNNPMSGTLAAAALYEQSNLPNTPGIYGGPVWDHIEDGTDPDPNTWDGQITFNFAHDLQCAPEIDDCSYDLFSVALHELTHLLGFASALNVDDVTGDIESWFDNSVFLRYDNFLHFYNGTDLWNYNVNDYLRIIDFANFPGIGVNPNGAINLTTNRIWLDNSAPFTNQPIFSRVGTFNPGLYASHFDDSYNSFFGALTQRTNWSPGFSPNYVMSPVLRRQQYKREYTTQELRFLDDLGYTLDNTYPDFAIINNSPPSHTGSIVQTGNYSELTPPSNNSNLYISTSSCETVTIDLANNTLSESGGGSHSLDFFDADNDPISVFEGHLQNLRGCGNGGNNHDQLTLNGTNDVITFTPRQNFIGRAQFAFHLSDGNERGSYIVITIDVERDIDCFQNTPSGEILINGDFEEGTEVRILSNPINAVIDGMDIEFQYRNKEFSDAVEYIGGGWNDWAIRESQHPCLFSNNGTQQEAFDPGPHPNPPNNTGDRYAHFAGPAEAFGMTLAEPLLPCNRYVFSFDIMRRWTTAAITDYDLDIALSTTLANNPPFEDIVSFTDMDLSTYGIWQHFEITHTYSGTEPVDFIRLLPVSSGYILVDNLSIIRDPEFNPTLAVSISDEEAICWEENITLTATVTGGESPYTYLWEPEGETTTSLDDVAEGTYRVTVTDDEGCMASDIIVVAPISTISVTPSAEFSCSGEVITLTASGSPTYLWSTGATTASINVTGGLTYTVTDLYGCSNTASITIPGVMVAVATATDFICGNHDGQLQAQPFGGEGPYTYLWSPTTGLSSSTVANPTVDLGGVETNVNYTVTITDANECVAVSQAVTVHFFSCCEAENPANQTEDGDQSTTWGSGITGIEFAINGEFSVNDDFTINNCDVLLGKDAIIFVEPGQTLTITNNSHLFACGDLWGAIHVRPGGRIEINGNSLIEDALWAVYLNTPMANAYTIDEAVFNRNVVHIYYFHSRETDAGTITNTDFTCTADLAPPFTGEHTYAGIFVYGASRDNMITVGAANDGNTFDNANFGIWSMLANITSLNNTFSNIVADGLCTGSDWVTPNANNCGSGIYTLYVRNLLVEDDNDFEDSRTGIYSNYGWLDVVATDNDFERVTNGIQVFNAPRPNTEITITGNGMTDVVQGIYCRNNPAADITIGGADLLANTIDVEPVNINFWGQNFDYGLGIYVQESQPLASTRIHIENNTVTNAPGGIGTTNTLQNNVITGNSVTMFNSSTGTPFGIAADNSTWSGIFGNQVSSANITDENNSGIRVSSGVGNWIVCNTTNTIGTGLHFEGALQPSFVLKNQMIDHHVGLLLNLGTLGNIGGGGSPPVAWDNTWEGGNFGETEGNPNTFAQNCNANGYTIFYRDDAGIYFPEFNEATNPTEEFDVPPTGTTEDLQGDIPECPEGTGVHGILGPGDLKNLVLGVLTDEAEKPVYHDELTWTNKLGIYMLLIENDSVIDSDPIITDFYDSCFASNMGVLIRAANQFEDVENNLTGGNGYDYLDSLESMTSSILPESTLLDVLTIAFTKQLDTNMYATIGMYHPLLISTLGGIDPDTAFAVGVNTNTYQTNQRTALEEIAEQCPFEYGPGVYMARAMLSVPGMYRNECEYYNGGSGKWDGNNEPERTQAGNTNADRTNAEFILYPNPNDGNMYLEYRYLNEVAQFELYDITGRKVADYNLRGETGKLNISETKLRDGIYVYRIISDTQKFMFGKVIISK